MKNSTSSETFELPRLSSREKSILSATVILGALDRYWGDIKNEARVDILKKAGSQTSFFKKEDVDNLICRRQEDVVTTLLYPNGMKLSEFLDDGPKSKVPYESELTTKILGRLMSNGSARITIDGWVELIPEGITLINHGPVDERFAHRLDIEVNGQNWKQL